MSTGSDRVVAVICARGGSKGLPGKNLRSLCGKPMIVWSIEAAAHARSVDRTLISTDDPDIAAVARAAGADVPFLRPDHLAGDDANVVDAVLHAVDTANENCGYVVLLQATSPLRLAEDIDSCVDACRKSGAPAAATLFESPKSPYWSFLLNQEQTVELVVPRPEVGFLRQALPQTYMPNGAVYVAKTQWLRENRTFWKPGQTLGVVMPAERSIDVDVLLDFRMAELLLMDRLESQY